jgi:hypothetical protein
MGWILKLHEIRSGKGFWKYLVNDWSYGGIYNARTGNPVNITLSGDTALTGERPQRPNLVQGVNPNLPSNRHRQCPFNPNAAYQCKVQEWFNIQAFVTPPTGTFGNVRRNSQVGPAFINTQMDLQKYVTLAPGKTMEFRLDAFNVFNTPNLGQPNASLASATSNQVANSFGSIQATVGTNGSVGTNGRRLQLGMIFRY